MHIYLIRHAEARSKEEDPDRSLSEQGKKDINKVSDHLRSLNINVEVIYHSGKLRAEQTAQALLGGVFSENDLQKKDGLNPLDEVEPIIRFISSMDEDIMLVGHLPFMQILASKLSGKGDEESSFSPGTVLCLEKQDSLWSIKWKVSPEAL